MSNNKIDFCWSDSTLEKDERVGEGARDKVTIKY